MARTRRGVFIVSWVCNCGAKWSVSTRRACRVIEVDTSTYHYKPRRPGQASLERIREICQTPCRQRPGAPQRLS